MLYYYSATVIIGLTLLLEIKSWQKRGTSGEGFSAATKKNNSKKKAAVDFKYSPLDVPLASVCRAPPRWLGVSIWAICLWLVSPHPGFIHHVQRCESLSSQTRKHFFIPPLDLSHSPHSLFRPPPPTPHPHPLSPSPPDKRITLLFIQGDWCC